MESQKREKTIPIIIFLVLQLFFIVIIASVIAANSQDDKIGATEYARQPAITIEGADSQLPQVSSTYLGLIERDIARVVQLNSDNFNIGTSKAVIRSGTLTTHEFPNVGGTYLSMVVDIPALEQSYQIYAHSPGGDEASEVLSYNTQYVICLDNNVETIYPNFQCQDGYPSTVRNGIVSTYLPYFSFNDFSASVSSDLTTIGIIPLSSGEVANEIANAYTGRVREAVSSLGISPDIFKYKILNSTNPSDTNYSLNQ